ncbi:MAG: hypothetical protein ACI9T7_003519 [Oleiphilaceae bacterium]|jgi:hypothetical protein
MKDQHDNSTGDLLAKPQKKRGRPRKENKASNTDKTIYRRAKITALIETGTPSLWSETICAQIMGMKKFSRFHDLAWKRYGELKHKNKSLLLGNSND